MTPLEKFLPYVLPHVVTCPNSLAEQEIRSVCIEFCSNTNAIQTTATQDLFAGTQDYDVDTPSQMTLSCVLNAFYGAAPLSPLPLDAIRYATALTGETLGEDVPASGTPRAYFIKTPGAQAVSLYPVPDATATNKLTVRASFAPSRTATSVDDVLFNDWVEVIAAGAIERLLLIPGQLFGDAKYAPTYAQKYRSGTNAAFIQARKGQLVSASRVQPVSFV